MDRKEFIKSVLALGLGLPFLSMMTSSSKGGIGFGGNAISYNGKVLIIGAGAAGLTAAYILGRYGIRHQVIEASAVYGGRVKKIEGFSDKPIDLGAEWIHTNPKILSEIVNDPSTATDIEVIKYSPRSIYIWKNGKLRRRNVASLFYSEHKFKNTTWFDFLETYIVPSIAANIVYNSPVKAIDYQGDKVEVSTDDDTQYTCDKVLVTVPLNILQRRDIAFTPNLPDDKWTAIDGVPMPKGAIKVFMEFTEHFYPDMLYYGGLGDYRDNNNGEKIFYDAMFRKESGKNVLALFCVGDRALEYTSLPDEQIIAKVLSELDEMFSGKATQTYVKHLVQNWTAEPYIGASYSHHTNAKKAVDTITQPINNKLYFAGEALDKESWATVHGAARSAYTAVQELAKKV